MATATPRVMPLEVLKSHSVVGRKEKKRGWEALESKSQNEIKGHTKRKDKVSKPKY